MKRNFFEKDTFFKKEFFPKGYLFEKETFLRRQSILEGNLFKKETFAKWTISMMMSKKHNH